jgi:transposase
MKSTAANAEVYTVLSDLVHGEVIGLAPDRTEASLAGLLTTRLEARQRAAVEAVCTDMHRPYLNAVADALPAATVVLDKFTCYSMRARRSTRCGGTSSFGPAQ